MYAAQLKMKPEYKDINRTLDQYNKYKNIQLHQLENIKRELEVKRAKVQSVALKNKMLEHQKKINYINEMDRIRGYLSSYDTRFPIGTIDRLKKREDELKQLVHHISN